LTQVTNQPDPLERIRALRGQSRVAELRAEQALDPFDEFLLGASGRRGRVVTETTQQILVQRRIEELRREREAPTPGAVARIGAVAGLGFRGAVRFIDETLETLPDSRGKKLDTPRIIAPLFPDDRQLSPTEMAREVQRFRNFVQADSHRRHEEFLGPVELEFLGTEDVQVHLEQMAEEASLVAKTAGEILAMPAMLLDENTYMVAPLVPPIVGPVLRSGPFKQMIGGLAKLLGPRRAIAVESILQSGAGVGTFSALAATAEGPQFLLFSPQH